MNLVLDITIILNILSIITLSICFAYSQRKNINKKTKEILGFVMGINVLIYLLFMLLVVIMGILSSKLEPMILILFIVAPFVIGHYSKFEKMKKYTIIQLVVFFISLATLFWLR